MNRGEMRDFVRIMIGETSQDGYLDTEINTILNISALKVATDLLNNLTFKDIAMEIGRERYALTSDFLSIKKVHLYDGAVIGEDSTETDISNATDYPIKILGYDEYQMHARTVFPGRPRYCRVEIGATRQTVSAPGDLWFRPIPDKEYVARCVHFQKPTPMTDDAHITEVGESGHLAICYHTCMLISRKFKDRSLTNEMAALWQEEINLQKKLVNIQDRSGPKRQKNVYG